MAKKNNKVIITCAVTGGIHVPSMSDYLPLTPEEISKQSIDAANAGASILHLHARDPKNGRPTSDPNIFNKFLPVIKESTDAVVNITTGGGLEMTVEQRLEALTYNIYTFLDDWEKPFLEASEDFIFRNTFGDVRKIVKMLGDDHGTKFEHECYDIGHLYNLHYFHREGMLKGPYFIQFVMGIMGGIGADADNLLHMKKTADKLFGEVGYEWSVVGAGATQMRMNATGASLGSHVRVGLEDSLWDGPGNLAKTTAVIKPERPSPTIHILCFII